MQKHNKFLKYYLISGTWSLGPPLPSPVGGGTVVTFEDSFMIVGGSGGSGNYETVLQFDPVNMDWIVRDQTLQLGRSFSFAIDVEKELFCV